MIEKTPEIAKAISNLKDAVSILNASEEPTTRDWSGFLKALSEFLTIVLPLITPLFTG